jgi:hypothetical protein
MAFSNAVAASYRVGLCCFDQRCLKIAEKGSFPARGTQSKNEARIVAQKPTSAMGVA